VVVFALAVAAACDESPIGPTPLDKPFTLAPGEQAAVEGTGLRVRFDRVEGDSRCPADAVCVYGGDAVVIVSVLSASASAGYELHTGTMAPVQHDAVTIALVDLQPYPFSDRTIQLDEYRATLRVTR
jgi:hypothetical protein